MPTATKRPDRSREAREYRRSTGASYKRGKSNTEYATPDDFMNAVTARFGSVSFDLAATKENAKAADYYDLAHDSLAQDWHKLRGLLFLNPPFDKIAPWAMKCAVESALGARIAFLIPASVDSNWFRDYVHGKALVLFLNGRLHFDPLHPTWGYPKGCLLALFSKEVEPGYEVWTWKQQ